ncbi:hypothetical protein HDU85_006344 [Gaertneriomyces sp. JEL0708]|nr:hypothetical protein HDU85_006344 [Gaertneriomyces sp. JEL0708]
MLGDHSEPMSTSYSSMTSPVGRNDHFVDYRSPVRDKYESDVFNIKPSTTPSRVTNQKYNPDRNRSNVFAHQLLDEPAQPATPGRQSHHSQSDIFNVKNQHDGFRDRPISPRYRYSPSKSSSDLLSHNEDYIPSPVSALRRSGSNSLSNLGLSQDEVVPGKGGRRHYPQARSSSIIFQ